MTRYVKLKSGTLVEVAKATSAQLVGYRVNRQGERIERVTKEHIQVFLHVFRPEDVACEMKMNLHYAELEKGIMTEAQLKLGRVLGYQFRPLTEQEREGLAGCEPDDRIAYAGMTILILTAQGSVIEMLEDGTETTWRARP